MPRIDPIQLLKCLTVLLSPSGGIRSRNEVARLASLMNKFSKKLVSKCIYIQILKATETNLLGLFMGAGGWDLAYTWLTDSIEAMNWPLAQELLELLLLCPVDVDRLKTNTCPKRVKELSKDNTRPVIRTLAGKLVEQWLKIVKGEYCEPLHMTNIAQLVNECSNDVTNDVKPHIETQDIKKYDAKDNLDLKMEAMYDSQATVETEVDEVVEDVKMPIDIVSVSDCKDHVHSSVKKNDEENSETETLPILKISMKDGKQIISKVHDTTIEKTTTIQEKNDSSKTPKEKEPKSSSSNKHKDKGVSHSTSKRSSSSRSSDGHSSKSNSDGQSSKSSSDEPSLKSSSDRRSSKSSSDKQRSSSSNISSSKGREKSKEEKIGSSSSRSSSSHRNKDSERHKDRKSSDKSKSSSSSSRDKHGSSKSSSSQSKSEKSHKDKDESVKVQDQNEKSKEALEKLQPPSIHKLGKIPKKSDLTGKKDGPSFSIEIRKPEDPKPKTIKMFNSKFRSHGLEEEAKPPPSRTAVLKKPTQPVAVPKLVSPLPSALLHKRTSPNRLSTDTPPEKKPKLLEHTDKPGAIKLIPPKPKPVLLLESDMFMDALTASASTNKKEPKKRKRRASESKDGHPTATEAASAAANDAPSPISSPLTSPVRSEPKSAPLRFYQDTLETEEDKVKEKESVTEEIRRSPEPKKESPSSPVPTDQPTEKLADKTTEKSTDNLNAETSDSNTAPGSDCKEDNRVPGGILTYHKKKGPKKTLRWRTADELEEIQYFELDENERVNVTKTFIDMKNLERVHERESFQKSRNFHDIMEEKMNYRPLILISIDAAPIEYGKNSREKDVQTAREKTVLQSIYFHKTLIPDSAAEPDVEVHSTTDPIMIPLDDVTGSLESTNDFRNTPWPEPKGLPPMNDLTPPQMFPPFGGGFPNQPFGMPSFQGMGPGNMPPGGSMGAMSGPMGGMLPGAMPPGVMPPGAMPPGAMPPGAMPPGVMPPGAMPPGVMPPGAMPPGPMPPGMMSDLMAQGGMTDMFGNQMFPNCPMPNGDGFNMVDNMNGPPMFPQGFPMNGPQGPNDSNGPNGNNFFFNGNRGGPRGGQRGSGPWRGKGPASGRWDGPNSRGRAGGARINKLCMHFSKKGSCKSGDKCAYMHPGVNCPY